MQPKAFQTKNRVRVVMTRKQLRSVLSSLLSASTLRSTEKERAYLRKTLKELTEQTA